MDRLPRDFGMSEAQFRPVVAAAAGEPIVRFEIAQWLDKRGPDGIRGRYAMPVVRYETVDGECREIRLFIKRAHAGHTGHEEAHHYAYLTAHGVPMPRVYGAFHDASGCEVLCMESLQEVEDEAAFLGDAERYGALLDLLATVNATTIEPGHAEQLRRDMACRPWTREWCDWLTWAAHIVNRIWSQGTRGRLGDEAKWICDANTSALYDLISLAIALIQPLKRMQTGLVHNDFYPGNTGYRLGTNVLCVFDVEFIGIDARFTDAARWLGAPDDVQARPAARADLAEAYRRSLRAHGGPLVSLPELLSETRLLWIALELNRHNLWEAALDEHENTPERQQARDQVCRDISKLLRFPELARDLL